MAAGSIILELAVRSGKVYLRTEPAEVLFGRAGELGVGAGRKRQKQSCKVKLEEMDKKHTREET